VLKRRAVPVGMVVDNITFESEETNGRATEIRLPAPVSCTLIGLTVEMTYSAASLIGRAAPVAVTILESEAPVLRSRLIALRERAPFDTMLALTSLPDFYTIFGEKSSSGRRWDKIRFQYLSADYLDIPPHELKVL